MSGPAVAQTSGEPDEEIQVYFTVGFEDMRYIENFLIAAGYWSEYSRTQPGDFNKENAYDLLVGLYYFARELGRNLQYPP